MFIAVGDPHFRIDNLTEVELYIERLLEVVVRHNPDFVVILGDLLHCHERIHTTVLNKAYELINRLRMKCKTYVLVGNHDYINNTQFLSDRHWMNGMKYWDNVYIIDKPLKHGDFTFCPYVAPKRFKEALTLMLNDEWKTSKVIFCHQEFKGCKMGSQISIEGDEWNDEDPFVISGHIHDKHQLKPNLLYSGSSMQHAYGESHDKTITLGNITAEGDVSISYIDLGLPYKKIIHMEMDKLQHFDPPTGNHIRINVESTLEEFKLFKKSKQYKDLLKKGVKIVFKMKHTDTHIDTPEQTEDFETILYSMIDTEKELVNLYRELVS